MKEQLIQFEAAKLAKEKGFDWLVTNMFKIGAISKGVIEEDNPYDNVNKLKGSAVWSRPTQTLLQKWLREVHKINVESNYLPNIQKYSCLYIPMTGKASRKDIEYVSKIRFDTYEEALELGLQEALKLI